MQPRCSPLKKHPNCFFGKRNKSRFFFFQQPSADINSKNRRMKCEIVILSAKNVGVHCYIMHDFDRSSVSNMQLEVVSFPETLEKQSLGIESRKGKKKLDRVTLCAVERCCHCRTVLPLGLDSSDLLTGSRSRIFSFFSMI